MKVTAIIKDNLISEVRKLAKGRNLTESLTIALKEWVALKHIKKLNSIVSEHPLEFRSGFSASGVRDLNRTK